MTDYLNATPRKPAVRTPRLRVLMNDVEIPGAISADCTSNNWLQADRFAVEFALSADPKYGLSWWSQQTDLLASVQIASNGADWQDVVVGGVDHLEVHPETGLIRVEGRDLSSRLIQERTQEAYTNKTASEVATVLAAKHNLTADVDATTTLVGQLYTQDHDHLTQNQFSRTTTDWDLLANLARQEGFDLYVTGTVLHFKKPAPLDQTPWLIQWVPSVNGGPVASNVNDLRLERALSLAKDITVTVKSWNSKKGTGFKKQARAEGAKRPGALVAANQVGTQTQNFVYVIPNLSEAEAQSRANELLRELSKFERVITWREPGDMTLTPRNLVKLDGTGTDWDQTYFIDHIARTLTFDGGFTMNVSAKNHDSRSQVVLS